MRRVLLGLFLLAAEGAAQVVSPVLAKRGQVDVSSLERLASTLYARTGARTPREKAEAIWRFFLTDGRFVAPGQIYHIAGWAYEEPKGEVLDPIKLLNSYGFGLCYHIAPVLEAVFEAGGFADARVWFLTGHTVAEVFYDGSYHYFDSDMMGYNPVGEGPVKGRRVASVDEIAQNGQIIRGLLAGPRRADPAKVDAPWYPADVRANAIEGLAELFTTREDNWVFPFTRYAQGHSMDFTLRPGERMIRYFYPADDRLYYLPFASDGARWREFPQEIARYNIRTFDGPRSQKDDRRWATGRLEYAPRRAAAPTAELEMPSPYVIIDAEFALEAKVAAGESLTVETSRDGGRTWTLAGRQAGPFAGPWKGKAGVIAEGAHGKLTAVSGSYGYRVRASAGAGGSVAGLRAVTLFAVNPRSLPEIEAGRNEFDFSAGLTTRWSLPIEPARFAEFAETVSGAEYVSEKGQGWVRNHGDAEGLVTFKVASPDGGELSGFDAGGRFLDLRGGLAPDKLTAETRPVAAWPTGEAVPAGSLEWAPAAGGPWKPLWSYDPKLTWRDGHPPRQALLWPEVDRSVDGLPAGTRAVWVRFRMRGMGIDDFRLAVRTRAGQAGSPLVVTQEWDESGTPRRHTERLTGAAARYAIEVPAGAKVRNRALILEVPAEP